MIAQQWLNNVVQVNPDGSAWGYIWESSLLGQHRVLSKPGGLQGFRSQLTIIPSLQLGVVALTNGEAAPLDGMIANALQTIIPSLEEVLSQHPPPLPQPSDPQLYVGYVTSLNQTDRDGILSLSGNLAKSRFPLF